MRFYNEKKLMIFCTSKVKKLIYFLVKRKKKLEQNSKGGSVKKANFQVGFLVLVLLGHSFAQVPRVIPYQGRLQDAFGAPINGTRNITFKLYTSEIDPAPIWTETHNNVQISNGLYNVMLGSITQFPPSVNFSRQYWLGVTIGSDPELTPRYKLGASPYALNFADTINADVNKKVIFSKAPYGFTVVDSFGTAISGLSLSNQSFDAGVYGFAGVGSNASGVKAISYGNGYALFAGYGSSSSPSAGLANSRYAGYFNGDVAITGKLFDSGNNAGSPGQVLSSTGSGISWVNPSGSSLWTDIGPYIRPNSNTNIRVYDADTTYDIEINSYSSSVKHNIFVYTADPYVAGSGFTPAAARTNIGAYDFNAAKYNFAIAGWSYLDYDTSAAVLGAKNDGSLFGALGMKIGETLYAGYFRGTTEINNPYSGAAGLVVRSKTGSTSGTWNTISSKGTGVVLQVTADSSVHNDGVLILGDKGTGSNRYFLRTDSWLGGWHWVNKILPSGEIEIQADSTAARGIYIHNSSAGVADTGIVVRNVSKAGIYIDSPGDCGLYIETSTGPGIILDRIDTDGIIISSPDESAIAISNPGRDGIVITNSDYSYGSYGLYSGSGSSSSDTVGYFYGHIRVRGNVYSGALMRVIPTGDEEGMLTSAITSSAHWVEHIGESRLSEGFCRVELPDYFTKATTVDEENSIQVFLTPYDDIGRYIVERGKNYFEVRQIEGNPDARFAYRVVAKARGNEKDISYAVNLKAEDEMNMIKLKENIKKLKD